MSQFLRGEELLCVDVEKQIVSVSLCTCVCVSGLHIRVDGCLFRTVGLSGYGPPFVGVLEPPLGVSYSVTCVVA